MKPKQLADGMGYFNDYNEFGKGRDLGTINFDGDTLKSTREILDGKDCIVSRITDKNGNTRISQIEYPLIYASDPEVVEHDKQVAKWLDKIDEDPQWLKEYKEKKNEHNAIRKRNT